MRELFEKYRDVIPYVFFGVVTTIINIAVYWLLAHPLHLPVMFSTVAAWIITVTVAYLTNRKWVFHSEAHTASEIAREVIWFFACRLATGILDWFLMYLFVKRLHFPDMPVKVFANVLVIVLNYVASKWFIFKKKNKEEEDVG